MLFGTQADDGWSCLNKLMRSCDDCQRIIDTPTAADNAEPHPAWHTDSRRFSTYGEVATYACKTCRTKFQRVELAGVVEWTPLP